MMIKSLNHFWCLFWVLHKCFLCGMFTARVSDCHRLQWGEPQQIAKNCLSDLLSRHFSDGDHCSCSYHEHRITLLCRATAWNAHTFYIFCLSAWVWTHEAEKMHVDSGTARWEGGVRLEHTCAFKVNNTGRCCHRDRLTQRSNSLLIYQTSNNVSVIWKKRPVQGVPRLLPVDSWDRLPVTWI